MRDDRNIMSMLWLVTAVMGLLLLCGCHGRQEKASRIIVQNEQFTVTGDSITEDTVLAWVPKHGDRIASNLTLDRLQTAYGNDSLGVRFVQGKSWNRRDPRPTNLPEYTSEQRLVDALYDLSADRIIDGIKSDGTFAVSHNRSRLYCATYLSLACLKPHQAMETLKDIVDRDSIIMQLEGQWPVVSDHIGWATAAWEVYKTTGDRKWLAYCYHVIGKTLSINSKVLLDYNTGLIHGAGFTSSRPLGARRMTWMTYNDLFSCMSLGNNILTANAYAILGEMGDELGIENEYDKDAQRLKDAINQHLWNESRGFYSSFLYAGAVPRQAPLTDNTSQAMCVLWGIADDDRAENLISQTPVSDCGVNVSYPAATAIEPYFTNASWATTQAMWNLAAAYTRNENALKRGLGALYRAQALYQSRDIHIQSINTDHLGTAASNAAMILRVLMGMNFKPEGIEFTPIVPDGFAGTKTLTGLNYRRAVLDITVEGIGNDVESFTDNGELLESAFLPNDIEGHHHIVITMKPSSHGPNKVTIHHGEVIMPPTPTVQWDGDSGHITDFVPGTPYRLAVNGKLMPLNDSVFALPEVEGLAEYSVEIAGKYINSYISRPYLVFHLTPQIAFFPDSTSGQTTIKVSVAEGGDYLLDMGYHPTGTLDVREVTVNSHPMGTLVMTLEGTAGINGLAYSNMVGVKLLKGENAIVIRQIRLPKTFTSCQPVHMRIIKR